MNKAGLDLVDICQGALGLRLAHIIFPESFVPEERHHRQRQHTHRTGCVALDCGVFSEEADGVL